jgi:hypothetical protein
MPRNLISLLPLAIVVLIVLRRAGRSQKVRTQRMWVTPLLGLVAVASALSREPVPGAVAVAILVAGTLAGAGAGYLRALHIKLSIEEETGAVTSKATPIGTALVVAFLLVRVGLDYAINGTWSPGPPRFVSPSSHGVDLFRLADAAMLFATAMTLSQRIEIFRRAQQLIGERKETRLAMLPPA